ncbi:MAG TPA: DUF4302 domain-containing protein [Cyclobacteriaceae bacterium]|nr:DUF4302 domain-containing protein [Cyclobacteriaceae bacterium]
MIKRLLYIGIVGIALIACRDDGNDLPSVEERTSIAKEELRSYLVGPANGWHLEYEPTPESGSYLILMKFDANGNLNIKSDVPGGGGEFYDQNITYRIDAALGLELILENYAVFHYLFELDQATFGAEFEFLYKGKDGENLIFESISDFSNPTVLTFTPASAGEENDFARELPENLENFKMSNPQIFGPILPSQQLAFINNNFSVFWTIDLDKRNLVAEFASTGTTRDEVINGNRVNINHATKFSYRNGQLVLDDPFSFNLGSGLISIGQVTLSDFSMTGPDLCATSVVSESPMYVGSSNSAVVNVMSTLLSNRGNEFTNTLYSVNAQFVFDADGNSLLDDGSIGQKLPNASGFIFVYGVELNNPDIPIYSVGFIMDDGELYVRQFQPTSTKVNLVQITLLDQYYYTATPPAGTEQSLMEITDEIFQGGEFYAFDEPVDGFKLFRLYNPCNKYEFFLVQ